MGKRTRLDDPRVARLRRRPALRAWLCALAAVALWPATGLPQQQRAAARQAIACLIGPERVADIGSPVIGVVAAVKVDNGDAVREGQPLVLLGADVESAGVHAAEARSAIDADVRAAEAALALARQRYARAVQLESQGFVSSQASEQARAEQDVAAQRLAQARGQRKVAASELGVVRAQLGQRTVRSPFDGVITERFVNAGERVEDKPLLRLAKLDPLRVELVLPAARYGTLAIDQRLDVQPELPGAAPRAARVTRIDKVIDAASNTFRVRLALPNPGHKLPAGARCKVDLPEAAATAAAPKRSAG
jgi:RND family efflux transporter MFP subunit